MSWDYAWDNAVAEITQMMIVIKTWWSKFVLPILNKAIPIGMKYAGLSLYWCGEDHSCSTTNDFWLVNVIIFPQVNVMNDDGTMNWLVNSPVWLLVVRLLSRCWEEIAPCSWEDDPPSWSPSVQGYGWATLVHAMVRQDGPIGHECLLTLRYRERNLPTVSMIPLSQW